MPTYTSISFTADSSHVKVAGYYVGGYEGYRCANQSNSLTGDWANQSWISAQGGTLTNQKYNMDCSSSYVVKRIKYANNHSSGANTLTGAKTFIFYGTNSSTAFDNTTYSDTTDLTQIYSGSFDEHAASNTEDLKYIVVTNSTSYRYYVFRIADCYGDTIFHAMGLRRIELQTEDEVADSSSSSSYIENWSSSSRSSVSSASSLSISSASSESSSSKSSESSASSPSSQSVSSASSPSSQSVSSESSSSESSESSESSSSLSSASSPSSQSVSSASSESSSSISSESSNSSSSSSSGVPVGFTWGCETPPYATVAEPWTGTWVYRGTLTQATTDGNWGRLLLTSTDSFVSNVKDSETYRQKRIIITLDNCDSGYGQYTLYYRASDTPFAKNDEITGPTWILYTTPVVLNYRYFQLRVDGV